MTFHEREATTLPKSVPSSDGFHEFFDRKTSDFCSGFDNSGNEVVTFSEFCGMPLTGFDPVSEQFVDGS